MSPQGVSSSKGRSSLFKIQAYSLMVKRDLYTVDSSGSIPDMPTKIIESNGPQGVSDSLGISHYSFDISKAITYDQNGNLVYADTYSVNWLF